MSQQARPDLPRMASSSENEDEAGDSDLLEDEEGPLDIDYDASSLLAPSISRAQLDMKSPTTPAAIKAQALDASKDYFDIDSIERDQIEDEVLEDNSASDQVTPTASEPTRNIEHVPEIPPSPSPPPVASKSNQERSDKPDKRSSFVSSILGSATNGTRHRSSSGSSMVESFRKRLPGLSSFNLPKFYGSSETEERVLSPAGPGVVAPSTATLRPGQAQMEKQRSEGGTTRATPVVIGSSKHAQLEAAARASTNSQPKQSLLRRSTSDQSLYLRKSVTGAADFDDYTAFADQSEMVNSRFKAITDSFQDSSLRRPKRLNITRSAARTSPARPAINDDSASQDTINTNGTIRSSDLQNNKPGGSKSQHPFLKDALSRLTGDLVIMGGYRGSILREADPPHRQLWVPIKVGMNLRKADLEVGLIREDELRMGEKIIADGSLSHIGPVDISRRLIKKCRKNLNVQNGRLRVHDYGYDWRLSPDLLSDRFIYFLENLPCNRKEVSIHERGAWLVSHSLGGLLTRHIVNKRPELVAGIVYAGTPQNCVNILGPLRNGDDVLFSSRVLTAQVNFTLRTSYVLLPQNGRCFINKQTGERYDIDFFDPKTWDEYRLSPCISQPLFRRKPEKKSSLMESISEVMSQPSRYSMSWFSSSTDGKTNNDSTKGPLEQVKDKVEDAADDVEGAAEAVKPERPLSPSMGDGSSRHHKPSVATQSTIPLPAATEYLSRTLASVLKFKQELSHNPTLQARNAYPPVGVLFSKNTPTVYGAFVKSREDIKYDDAFDELAFAAGDGVVLASAAQLPAGYRCVKGGRVESERGHVGLLGDLEGVGRCLIAVSDARKRGVGLGAC
ncbi:hypothetical protein LTR64_008285 [Lithohypha guttulata]|uniref:uncharacterized protein n=1 Tax=Lithohypha guttulata TaxID=1690604 RepID=UPI002DE02763|nr:hypothetical protein LTR51_008437 [Lithohypha guttulata]